MHMDVPYRLAVLLLKLKSAGCTPIRREGEEYRCRCPAHDDNGPSLYIRTTEDRLLLSCRAGCPTASICDRLDHDLADLFFNEDEPLVELDGSIDGESANVTMVITVMGEESPVVGTVPDNLDLRHAVYGDLLAGLELSLKHFDALRKRGLTGEMITANGYKTIDTTRVRVAVDALLTTHGGDTLLKVPGFRERNGQVVFHGTNGFLVPVRDLRGRIVALKVRHDNGYNGGKYTWASTPGASCGSPVHVPLGVSVPSATVRLSEGELKSDIATALSGVPTVSAPGVGNWRLAVPVLRELGAETVLLAFDQDGKRNTVAIIETALYGLTRAGFEVVLEWWNS